MTDDPITAIALDELTRRTAAANRLVKEGKIPAANAARQLAPWRAIALICDAPEVLAAQVEDYRRTIIHYPGNGAPAVYGHLLPLPEARRDLAADLCPAAVWRQALEKARDAALAKATTPDRVARARNLCILARSLNVALTAASCTPPPEPERIAS
ncbi:MAG: hypothetical protein VYD90_12690 [Pseudomonadota bacterium]|nr:hypothetical protein [Pseudomonadota bacterium]